MILMVWSHNLLSTWPALIVPTVTSCFLSNAVKAWTAEWKLFQMLPSISQISFSIWFAFILPYNILPFLKAIINSWEIYSLKSYKPMKAGEIFYKTRKESINFGQTIIFIKSSSMTWRPLTKLIFILLILLFWTQRMQTSCHW